MRNFFSEVNNALEMFELKEVCIFPSKELLDKDLACSFALKEYFKNIGVKAEVVLHPDSIKNICEKYPAVISKIPEKNTFMGIVINSRNESYIDADDFMDTYMHFLISEHTSRAFCVKNYYNDKESISELIFNQMYEFNKDAITLEVVKWLYVGLVAHTNRYSKCTYDTTFEYAKKLVLLGAEIPLSTYITEYKDTHFTEYMERIVDIMDIDNVNKMITILIDKEEFPNQVLLKKVLKVFRNMVGINLTVVGIRDEEKDIVEVIILVNDLLGDRVLSELKGYEFEGHYSWSTLELPLEEEERFLQYVEKKIRNRLKDTLTN